MKGGLYKNTIDVNPFFVYIAGFMISLVVYQLNWSYLYPRLSFSVFLFLFFTFLISGAIGLYIYKKGILRFQYHPNTLPVGLIFSLIVIGYLCEFVYARQIPLLAILHNLDVDYQDFGIPTFHVVLVTFASFYTVYLFYCFIVQRRNLYLIYCLLLFIFPILIFSRGTILLNLSSIFFVYLFSVQKNKWKVYLRILLIVFVVLMGFGILGNIRTQNQIDKNGTTDLNDIILNIGEAKPSFINSPVPKAYFWSYLYISSPLANFQYDIDHTPPPHYNASNIAQFANSELIFDFISKRISAITGWEKPDNQLIAPFLTVGTTYSTSFTYLGWVGVVVMFFAIMGTALFYIVIIKPTSPFFVTIIAILSTMMLFSIFDNMFAFSGLSFQLVYPLILSIKKRSY